MKKSEQDKLLTAIVRAVDPTIKLTEHVSITPNLPNTVDKWKDPLQSLGERVTVTVKPDKTTSIKIAATERSVNLTLTKKF